MWTNVFKIGGLHHVSWFQFIPSEPDLNTLTDKGVRAEQKDAATYVVLSSHLQLQTEGFLSTWTNSFVGPWDPSQGLHNPDEKIKLWLFLPGHHSSVVETAHASLSRLRVVASGVWLAPGDSEEVAVALSQALRNCIGRALAGFSYMRFGDVFSKYNPSQIEESLRRGQLAVEFVFAATEEAIFVHVMISAKNMRVLLSGDVERALNSSDSSSYRVPAIVSPHGMRGKITGFCPTDLVKQVYLSSGQVKTSSGYVGIQNHVAQGSGCQMRGGNCFVEVTLGCPKSHSDKATQSKSNSAITLPKHHFPEPLARRKDDQKGLTEHSLLQRTFIYPVEALLVPVLRTSYARSSLKRFWLQNWTGPSSTGSSFFMHWDGNLDSAGGSCRETKGLRMQNGFNSSSNSNSSSSSSDSDYKMAAVAGDLEADADSLTCMQSGLTSNNQMEYDRPNMASKRTRPGMGESFSQMGVVANATAQAGKSNFGSMEVNTSAITVAENEQIGSHWNWEEDDRVIGMEALLSEFGDFGDFFETEALPFGEPPGTAESQALVFAPPDSGIDTSPVAMMDVSDQMLLPVGFSSFESFNPTLPAMDECTNKNQDVPNSILISASSLNQTLASSNCEFDHLMKAEANMSFAPEYGVVDTPTSEISSSIFKNPYFPPSRNMESSNSSANSYTYGATPPSTPYIDGSDEKNGTPASSKTGMGKIDAKAELQSKTYYTQVEGGKGQHERRSLAKTDSNYMSEGMSQSQFLTYNSTDAVKPVMGETTDSSFDSECALLSMRTVLATDVECIMFQASMCRMRHILVPTRFSGNSMLNQLPGEPKTTPDTSARFEVRKKDSIPVRIAGDFDGGMVDGHLTAPVGVWRSVGVPKVSKSADMQIEVSPSLLHNAFKEEGLLCYGERRPLQELLDGMALLVQQATSFVDLALDTDCGDGPYGWLALHEQWRRELSCGPFMSHAGCGGTLASCHSLDIAGLELVDPLSAEIHPSTVISLLQSEIKTALKSAFGILDGPLSVTDWCKGRSQSTEAGAPADGSTPESTLSECRDSLSGVLSVVDSMSPSQTSAGVSSGLRVSSALDGGKFDEASQRKTNLEICSTEILRPALFALPSPAILVGYQDDWLKTSAGSIQHWEKAPLEPYALQKPISYRVICPDIVPLTSAATDFFSQLGTVYEACGLGTHSPHNVGNQMEIDGKWPLSGFVLLDCPQSMKMDSKNASLVGSISDYFLSLSNGWDVTSYLKSLSGALKTLKLASYLSTPAKEGTSNSCTVIYVVCPFPEPKAVLQTIIESSVAVGSVIQSDRERRSVLHNQVRKALNYSLAVDEASVQSIPVLSGFSIPKLVVQIVTVDTIFRVTSPASHELVILKEIAFTIYNKARRISRGSSNDGVQSSSLSSRSTSALPQMNSMPGMWKDCVGSRMMGPSLPREVEMDVNLRSGNWDSSWQTPRVGGLSCDPNRNGELYSRDEVRYMFEPLFILAESGSVEHGVSPPFSGKMTSESAKLVSDDNSGIFSPSTSSSGVVEAGSSSQLDGLEPEKNLPSIHCCYGWTEDWRWLVCVWTDAKGELLENHIFPFGGISSRQDTKGLQCLFVQVLHQGCQILQACSSSDPGITKPRDFVITRIGVFFELEYLEWQKAINSVGGSEVKKWHLQLRRSVPEGVTTSSNGTSLQQQEMSLMQERTLSSSHATLYSSHSKAGGFMKGGLGQVAGRKQLIGGHSVADSSRGLLQWVRSISFASISIDHSLNLVLQAESSPGGHGGSVTGQSGYLEGFTPVKSLGSASVSYMLIPSPSMRFLPPAPLQLPTCLTVESPPLAHLLHSKGSAIPLCTAFVVSKAVPSTRKDSRINMKEDWPSVLSISLVDYYGASKISQEKIVRGCMKPGGRTRDTEVETHLILESVAAELHALSWMTASPLYLDRRTALPFHSDMVLRLRRLLHFADKELSRQPDLK